MEKKSFDVKTFLRKYLMLMVLVGLLIFFSLRARNFFSGANLMNIVLQCSYTIVAGLGLSFLMISGGMDLSVGYQMSLMSVVIGILLKDVGMPPFFVILIALVMGCLMGLLNGILVVKLQVVPLIITLATSYAFEGLSYLISNSASWLRLPGSYTWIGQGYVGPVPVAVIIMLVLTALAWFVLSRTYFGRYVYGVGGNAEAMKLAGINVDRLRIFLYVLSSFFVALATVMMVARSGSASSTLGIGTEFTCLTAGILGGISIAGGRGSVVGMIIGILILQVLGNGMQLMGLGVYPQYIVKGVVLVAAVGFDSYQRLFGKTKKRVRKETPAAVGAANE